METMNDKNYNKTQATSERRKFLYRYREGLEKTRIKSYEYFDKYLLTFATGTLVLSINFTSGKVLPLAGKSLLFFGWVCLIICILSTLISFVLGEKVFYQEILRIDGQIKRLDNEEKQPEKYSENKYSLLVRKVGYVALVTFILGFTCLTMFYFVNIN
jgi:hypothetical protein